MNRSEVISANCPNAPLDIKSAIPIKSRHDNQMQNVVFKPPHTTIYRTINEQTHSEWHFEQKAIVDMELEIPQSVHSQ